MKNLTKNNFKISSLLILMLFTLFSACKKEETTDTTVSSLRVVNGSPALSTYNVYLNGSQINPAALPFAGSISYSSHAAGAYNLKFTTGSTTASLLSKDLTLNQSAYQSFYLINRPAALDGFTVGDDLSIPSTDKAYVRFINLSPDAPTMDLVKTGTTTATWFTGRAFKTASGFLAVDGGTYALDAKETTGGTVKTSLSSVTFTAGYHYDIIYGGLVTPANDTERPVSLQALLIK